jgi:uncharacterized membrane protein YgcG
MKRFFLFLIAAALFVPSVTHAQIGEIIRRFEVYAVLQSDRTYQVTETIEYDFGVQQRQGIYRVIPVVYDRAGAKYRLRLDVGPSTLNGGPVEQKVTNEGSNIRIRLGTPGEYLTGRRVYTITYTTNRAINDFLEDGERELYWNVTGNGWEVPIEKASFTLVGPTTPTKTICFTGYFGSTAEACVISSEDSVTRISANERLEPGEGLTFAVRYPADAIAELPWWRVWLDLVIDNIWLLMPIMIFILMYGIWYRFGKEPAGRGTVIAQYEEPHGLPPAVLAALLDQGVSQKAVTATLLDLARRGYMKIKITGDPASRGWFTKKATYHFVKLERSETGLLAFERTLLDGLFDGEEEVSLEDKTDGSFWTSITSAHHQIFTYMKSQGYFRWHPQAIRAGWMTGGVMFGMFFAFFGAVLGWLFSIAAVLSGLIIIAFGWLMPQKTKKGSVLAEEAEGFKLFLSVTERDRLNFTDAPERKPEQFARFLPAAVAFGVEEKWGKQFKGMMVQPPSYVEGSVAGWSAGQYVTLVDSMHSASTSSLYHSPSSGGSGGSGFSGGGSGGGGGGGGGGSW